LNPSQDPFLLGTFAKLSYNSVAELFSQITPPCSRTPHPLFSSPLSPPSSTRLIFLVPYFFSQSANLTGAPIPFFQLSAEGLTWLQRSALLFHPPPPTPEPIATPPSCFESLAPSFSSHPNFLSKFLNSKGPLVIKIYPPSKPFPLLGLQRHIHLPPAARFGPFLNCPTVWCKRTSIVCPS